MINVVAFASLLLNVIVVAMVIVLLRKVGRLSNEASFVSIEKAQDKLERNMREDLALIRQEIGGTSRQNREELSGHLQKMNQSLLVTLGELTKMNEQKLERVRGVIEQRL
ncbi:MAG: hypothetical protein K0R75_1943, partial [Paenibacillaceae bacterium]|nr:hypothetical protein [Paenibacillaceae bacterium]